MIEILRSCRKGRSSPWKRVFSTLRGTNGEEDRSNATSLLKEVVDSDVFTNTIPVPDAQQPKFHPSLEFTFVEIRERVKREERG